MPAIRLEWHKHIQPVSEFRKMQPTLLIQFKRKMIDYPAQHRKSATVLDDAPQYQRYCWKLPADGSPEP
jgi:hypothetical protein